MSGKHELAARRVDVACGRRRPRSDAGGAPLGGEYRTGAGGGYRLKDVSQRTWIFRSRSAWSWANAVAPVSSSGIGCRTRTSSPAGIGAATTAAGVARGTVALVQTFGMRRAAMLRFAAAGSRDENDGGKTASVSCLRRKMDHTVCRTPRFRPPVPSMTGPALRNDGCILGRLPTPRFISRTGGGRVPRPSPLRDCASRAGNVPSLGTASPKIKTGQPASSMRAFARHAVK